MAEPFLYCTERLVHVGLPAHVARKERSDSAGARDFAHGVLRPEGTVVEDSVHCRRCGGVKQERLEWLAANPHYTKRFALFVGKQCRGASIKEVADYLRLD